MKYMVCDDYLMHHGVKGMRWGIRHERERVGRRRGYSDEQYKRKGLSKGAKTAIALTTAAAATAATAAIAKKTGINVKAKDAFKIGKSFFKAGKAGAKMAKEARKMGKSYAPDAALSMKTFIDNEKELKMLQKKVKMKDSAKSFMKAAPKKVGDIIKTRGKDTASGIFDGLKTTANTYTGKKGVSRLINNGLEKGLGTAGTAAIAGTITLGINTAISGEKPDRQKLASWLTTNPNKKK